MKEKTVLSIAARMADVSACTAEPLPWEEGGGFCSVWRISGGGQSFLLKKSNKTEHDICRALSGRTHALPLLLGETVWRGIPWLLLENISGGSLRVCTREALIAAIDAMAEIQRMYWDSTASLGESVSDTLPLRSVRRKYLPGLLLRRAFDRAMSCYRSCPVTLCHDDMLPKNVLFDGKRAVLLNWEYAGMLPWPVMMARFLAHTSESGVTPFFLSDDDLVFALDYYYERLPRLMGIPRGEYDRVMGLFIFYELTEWIYVYRKCARRHDKVYEHYLGAARAKAKEIMLN